MRVLPGLTLALCLLGASAGQAACRLALALGLDVSSSVDAREYALQRDGLAAALLAPDLRAVLLDGSVGWVALAVYEWSGPRQHGLVSDWVEIRSAADLSRVAATIGRAERSYANFPTAMGPALSYGATLLARGPDCLRRTLDMSGDGIANDGYAPYLAYKNFPFAGVTVNGLVIAGSDPQVLPYYRHEVIRGPAAFVEVAGGYEDFERAMHRKLVRETQPLKLGQATRGQE